MQDQRRAIASDLGRLPIVFNLGAVSLAEGVRAGLSVAVIAGAAQWWRTPGLMEAALAALFTCLSDAGGPMRRRAPALLSMAGLGALIVIGGGLVRGLGLWGALPFAAVLIFAGAFARIYGQSAQQVGMLLSFVVILSLDHAAPSFAAAARLGGMFLAGGLWATLLTLGIWRIHPFRPVRRAVASVYETLALSVEDLRKLLQTADPAAHHWDLHARTHRRAVRDAIEAARAVVLDTLRSRGPTSARATQSVMRLEAADQLFGALIAFADHLENAGPADRALAGRILRRLRPLLSTLARSLLAEDDKVDGRLNRSIAAIAAEVAGLPRGRPVRRLTEAITERLQVAYTVDAPGAAYVDSAGDADGKPWPQRVLEPLQANLSWNSVIFRHALRADVAAMPAIAFTVLHFNPYDHWLTITIIATMQPYFGNTFSRALERAGGTLAGGLIAAVLGLALTSPLAVAAAMFPLAVIALAIRQVSFGLYMAALTPMVVLLVQLGQPGSSEWAIAGARAGMTVAGCLIAVAGCYLLWPSWEPDRLVGEIRAAIAAHGAYAEAVFSLLLKDAHPADVDQARRQAGLATNNAEASVSRALLEPGRGDRDRLEAAMVIDAALRRLAGRLSAMQLDPALGADLPPPLLRTWRSWIAGAMRRLATGDAELSPRPPPSAATPSETLGRIGRQIELMAGTMDRLASERSLTASAVLRAQRE